MMRIDNIPVRRTIPVTATRLALSVVVVTLAIGALSIVRATSASSAGTSMYYLALGDSYTEGYQPGFSGNAETLNGYTDQLDQLLTVDNYPMTLENFGCGRATTTTILVSKIGCKYLAADGVPYPTTTQVQAAVNFITAHPGQIGLVTIAIGFNDFNRCAGFVRRCEMRVMKTQHTRANIVAITAQLRHAVGASVPIMALTYPDVFLGKWLDGGHSRHVADLSTTLFHKVINPVFAAAYAPANVSLVDVTALSGAYTKMNQTVTLAPYGVIPESVAQVCTLTWYCSRHDVHPQDAGYAFIARALEQRYLSLVAPGG